MDQLCPAQRFWLCIVIIVVSCILCVFHICRSIWLNKGFSEITIKMYVAYFAVSLVAVVGLSGVIQSDAFAGLLGAVLGYVLGEKAWVQEEKI